MGKALLTRTTFIETDFAVRKDIVFFKEKLGEILPKLLRKETHISKVVIRTMISGQTNLIIYTLAVLMTIKSLS